MATYDINNLGQALYATLNAVVAYGPGTSTSFGGRVYPQRIPEGDTWPACSYYIISNTPEEVNYPGTVIDIVRVQVSIFGETYAQVQSLSDAVRVDMIALSGEINSTSFDSVRIVDETDLYEDDIKIYHRAQDYIIRVKNFPLFYVSEATNPKGVSAISYSSSTGSSAVYIISPSVSWTATDTMDWITLNQTSGSTTALITITRTENTGAQRSGTISFTSANGSVASISITQASA